MLDIEVFGAAHIRTHQVVLSLDKVCDNIAKGLWSIAELDNKFTLSKDDIAEMIFCLVRGIPVISLNVMTYVIDGERKNVIVKDYTKVIGLMLYFNGVYPSKRNICIKDILENLNNKRVLKKASFEVKSSGTPVDITYEILTKKEQSMFSKTEVFVTNIFVDNAESKTIDFVKNKL